MDPRRQMPSSGDAPLPMGVADPSSSGRSEDNDSDSGPTKEDLW
jgi:hypothetical protein